MCVFHDVLLCQLKFYGFIYKFYSLDSGSEATLNTCSDTNMSDVIIGFILGVSLYCPECVTLYLSVCTWPS